MHPCATPLMMSCRNCTAIRLPRSCLRSVALRAVLSVLLRTVKGPEQQTLVLGWAQSVAA